MAVIIQAILVLNTHDESADDLSQQVVGDHDNLITDNKVGVH